MALRHAEPGEVVDLRPLGDGLAAARTSAVVRTPSFEAVRLVVRAGAEIPTHKLPGRIMLQCIEGEVELGLSDGSRQLRPGDWTYLEAASRTRSAGSRTPRSSSPSSLTVGTPPGRPAPAESAPIRGRPDEAF